MFLCKQLLLFKAKGYQILVAEMTSQPVMMSARIFSAVLPVTCSERSLPLCTSKQCRVVMGSWLSITFSTDTHVCVFTMHNVYKFNLSITV